LAAQVDKKLGLEAEWCRRYANINAVALRKILKKHDKACGLSTGHEWLQVMTFITLGFSGWRAQEQGSFTKEVLVTSGTICIVIIIIIIIIIVLITLIARAWLLRHK
jgi:hypothetical protein